MTLTIRYLALPVIQSLTMIIAYNYVCTVTVTSVIVICYYQYCADFGYKNIVCFSFMYKDFVQCFALHSLCAQALNLSPNTT